MSSLAEAQAAGGKAASHLVPLVIVWEEASDVAEGVSKLAVKLGEGVSVQVRWGHAHTVRDFANAGTIS